MYNKTEEKPIGKKRVQVVNPRNGRKYSVEFVVAQGKGKPLLGLRASEQMQLISVVRQNIMAIQSEEPLQSKTPLIAESILKEHADVFRREGKLEGDLHLEIYPNNNEFLWDGQVRGAALEETKKIFSTTPVLKYFDPGATPTLQCDASMHGLGACLMQDGHPVAHASRSLTPTEVQYVQIEKELLAIVIAMEKFETYLYGRKVLVESDQKPLEAIFKKSLLSTPKRLQCMLLRLQRYEFEVSYKKGPSLLMADPLSRLYLSLKEAPEDQENVMAVSETKLPTEIEAEQVNILQYLPVKDETLCQIQNLTQEDAILKTLAGVIKQGWPESKPHLPPDVQDYFPFKEELTLQNGVIFKGDRVVIPFQMRTELKRKLDSSHLGVQACQRRAREAFYWPGMYKEIEEYVSQCTVWNTYHQGQQGSP